MRAQPEEALQCAVAAFCEIALRPPTTWTAINPLPGKRSLRQAVRMKRMGLKPKWPDMLFCHPGFVGWIELKADKRKPDDGQLQLHANLRACGHQVAVCWNIDQVIGTLRGWGIPVMAQARAAE